MKLHLSKMINPLLKCIRLYSFKPPPYSKIEPFNFIAEKAVKLAITSMQKFFSAVEKPVFFTKKSTTMSLFHIISPGYCMWSMIDTFLQDKNTFHFLSVTGTIQGLQITTGDFSANTKKDIMYETVKPESGNEFQAMLVGVGALISLFLFIIIIQHCKKSSSSIKRNVSRQSSNNIALHNEPSYLGNRRGYNVISERPKNHSHTSFEVQYAEIPDSLELNTQSTSTSQDNYETSQSFYQNSSITDSNGDTMNVEFVEDNAEQLTISVDSSNSYLKPIFVPKIQTRLGEELKNVYINVEQE